MSSSAIENTMQRWKLGVLKGCVSSLKPDDSNDVLYAVPFDLNSVSHHVVLFGGDIQDYEEAMQSHQDNRRYIAWSLEATRDILCRRFPEAAVWVVRPNRMHLRTFAVYSTFLDFNDVGVPDNQGMTPDGRALAELDRLLAHCLDSIVTILHQQQTQQQQEATVGADVAPADDDSHEGSRDNATAWHSLGDLPVDVLGFSKGCVVLNQVTRELAWHKCEAAESDATAAVGSAVSSAVPGAESQNATRSSLSSAAATAVSLVHRLRDMYWLDGGHGGSCNAWLTDDGSLSALCRLGVHVRVHVTPYQVRDSRRMWICEEERKFVARLSQLGAAVTETMHFADDMPSLENHFELLKRC